VLAINKHLWNSIKSERPLTELVFKHGQLPLSTFVPCVFLYVFTIFAAKIETGKTRGNVSVHIRMQKYQCNSLVGFEFEITSLVHRVGLGRL